MEIHIHTQEKHVDLDMLGCHSSQCPAILHGIWTCWSTIIQLTSTKYGLSAIETSSFTLKFGLDGPRFISDSDLRLLIPEGN